MRDILQAYDAVGEALNRLEANIGAADRDEYKQAGQDFIRDMAWCYHRMKETHIIYRSDVGEAKAAMIEPITPEVYEAIEDEPILL